MNKGLDVLSYDAENLFNKNFKHKTDKQTVLIVGHSNTTPAFVNAIIGKKKIMQKAENTFISSTFWTERIG